MGLQTQVPLQLTLHALKWALATSRSAAGLLGGLQAKGECRHTKDAGAQAANLWP